ncbi:MerR family transcriptional regulator [Pseudonocardia ailaonensis]|uniref:MerR family transcriptional regulator n=1 Tax=Pseudonocardia ailaonensis TaxID=367279 RepID=A0ABN2NEF4_9PSEU
MDPEPDGPVSPGEPGYSTGWVARRLGVAPATLRTWQRRYALGPSGRTPGGHRRYLAGDLERLGRMRRLMLSGMLAADAARVSADPASAPPGGTPADRSSPAGRRPARAGRLLAAALALDQPAVESLLARAVTGDGVVAAWTGSILPVLVELGERFEHHGTCVDVEHLFTVCVRAALEAVTVGRDPGDGSPPVLLACPDTEQHDLPLFALAAALAELGCPSRILGASVPAEALAAAARRLAPCGVFVWAHDAATARAGDLARLPPRRPPVPIVLGGPGWQGQTLPPTAHRVGSLAEALAALVPTPFVS